MKEHAIVVRIKERLDERHHGLITQLTILGIFDHRELAHVARQVYIIYEWLNEGRITQEQFIRYLHTSYRVARRKINQWTPALESNSHKTS